MFKLPTKRDGLELKLATISLKRNELHERHLKLFDKKQ